MDKAKFSNSVCLHYSIRFERHCFVSGETSSPNKKYLIFYIKNYYVLFWTRRTILFHSFLAIAWSDAIAHRWNLNWTREDNSSDEFSMIQWFNAHRCSFQLLIRTQIVRCHSELNSRPRFETLRKYTQKKKKSNQKIFLRKSIYEFCDE